MIETRRYDTSCRVTTAAYERPVRASVEGDGLQRRNDLVVFSPRIGGGLGPPVQRGEGFDPVLDQAVRLLFAILSGEKDAEGSRNDAALKRADPGVSGP